MISDEQLDRWEALIRACPPVPEFDPAPYDQMMKEAKTATAMGMIGQHQAAAKYWHDLIAASREALPALIAEVRRLRGEVYAVRDGIWLGRTAVQWDELLNFARLHGYDMIDSFSPKTPLEAEDE